VDASHPTSSNPAFIFMAEHLRQTGLLAPEVKHVDLTQGFLVLSDLGDMTFLKYVNEKNADSLYLQALKDLVQIQKLTAQVDSQLPTFDDSFILRECGLFHEWFLQIHLQLELSAATQQMLQQTYQRLAELIAKQPNVCVHRDYHSRNLMWCEGRLGILDFQDAVLGPVTYDVVSLLKDCYIAWPKEQVQAWALQYLQWAEEAHVLSTQDPQSFLHDLNIMGVQRHLKAVGIFSRLHWRDNKEHYLKDIPRTLNYVVDALKQEPDFADFYHFLNGVVLPQMQAVNV